MSMALPGSLYSERLAGNLPWVRMCHVSSRNSTKVSGEWALVGCRNKEGYLEVLRGSHSQQELSF